MGGARTSRVVFSSFVSQRDDQCSLRPARFGVHGVERWRSAQTEADRSTTQKLAKGLVEARRAIRKTSECWVTAVVVAEVERAERKEDVPELRIVCCDKSILAERLGLDNPRETTPCPSIDVGEWLLLRLVGCSPPFGHPSRQ